MIMEHNKCLCFKDNHWTLLQSIQEKSPKQQPKYKTSLEIFEEKKVKFNSSLGNSSHYLTFEKNTCLAYVFITKHFKHIKKVKKIGNFHFQPHMEYTYTIYLSACKQTKYMKQRFWRHYSSGNEYRIVVIPKRQDKWGAFYECFSLVPWDQF